MAIEQEIGHTRLTDRVKSCACIGFTLADLLLREQTGLRFVGYCVGSLGTL